MSQQTLPFIEGKFGWNLGESGWNSGMDENIVKFSFLFDRNIDAVVSTLPAPVNGKAYYLNSDSRLYFAVGGVYYSTPLPKWFTFVIRTTGQIYQFDGTSINIIETPQQLDGRLDSVELELDTLGTASKKDVGFFASQTDLAAATTSNKAYTDSSLLSSKTDLANNADNTKGAFLVGYSGTNVGARLNNLSDSTNSANGAALVGFMNRSVYSRLREQISIYDFFVVGQTNWDTAFANAANYLRSFPGIPPELVFPSGIYSYTTSPNWAVQFGKITGSGATRLRYSGTGDGFIIDGNLFSAMNGVYNMTVSGIIYEGPSTSLNGFKFSAVHHCEFNSLRVDGCGITSAGIDVNFAVCSKFNKPEVSVNSAGNGTIGAWYKGSNNISAKPLYGMRLNQRALGEQVAYCYIDNPIMEGVDTGIQGLAMLGTSIVRGTLEGCTNVGLSLAAGCLRNIVNHVDFEVNVNADIYNSGAENKFIDIDSEGICIMNAGEYSHIVGGTFHSLTINAGATGTILSRVVYNRANNGGVYTNNGVKTTHDNIRDAFEADIHKAKPATTGITVTASPFSYSNTTGDSLHVYTVGGTVSQITRKRGSGAAQSTGSISGGTYLAPGDTITVTYTVAPAMYFMTD